MNSKLLLLITLLSFISCGVKGPPSPPKGTEIGNWENNFLNKKQEVKKQTEENKKQKQ